MPDPTVLFIEGTDFDSFPAGGQLTTARYLMKLFSGKLALVGMTSGGEPVGQWTEKEIRGSKYWFFPVCQRRPSARRPLIPTRLAFYAGLLRHRSRILSLGCRAAFLQAPEALLAVSDWNFDSLCFRFAGVANPLKGSRYKFAAPLSGFFDRSLFSALERVSVILASADEDAINNLVFRSNGRLARERLVQFPTCVDTSEFRPRPALAARDELSIPRTSRVFVNSGRIGRLKGWELLVDSFEEYLRHDSDALLFFVGDGEDRAPLERRIEERNLQSRVRITGFQKPAQIVSYLNAADVAVFGSFLEGWSVGMLEALACGKAIVSTEVSGSETMVTSGRNGFVVKNRNPVEFAAAMRSALDLAEASPVSTAIAARFDLNRLGQRLGDLWPPLLPSQPASV